MPPLRPPLLDVGIALAFVALNTAESLSGPVDRPALHAVVGGLALACLAWRRLCPTSVTVVVVATNLALNPDGVFSTLLSVVLMAFSLGSHATRVRRVVGLAVILLGFVLASVQDGLEPSDLAAGSVFFLGPWALGLVVSGRLATASAEVAEARRVQEEREEQARRAAEEERVRIARELHDVVSHSLSVVTIQAQAVRRRLDPGQEQEIADLRAIEETAREALGEMRTVLGVLRARGTPADLAPQPGLAELDRLVAGGPGDRTRTRVRVEGTAVPLAPGLDLAAYRIAQEGLTNAWRHSGAAHVEVVLRYADDLVEVEVSDDGRGIDPAEQPLGHGLVGVRERTAVHAGTMEVGPRPGGGTRLRVSLPVPAP